MQEPRTKCVIPWCGGHRRAGSYIHHRREVGTSTAQGAAVTVALMFLESTAGEPDVGPGVTAHWPHVPGDGIDEPARDGIDLQPAEALALSRLLIKAYVQIIQPSEVTGE